VAISNSVNDNINKDRYKNWGGGNWLDKYKLFFY
jgi:hypothetical protein